MVLAMGKKKQVEVEVEVEVEVSSIYMCTSSNRFVCCKWPENKKRRSGSF